MRAAGLKAMSLALSSPTDHARQWIERIWEPLRVEGGRLLALPSSPARKTRAFR
jgi:hypothetical protein